MTTPRDAIAGLSERLRKTLGCIEPDDFRGDNLAIFIASELEPSIDDETLDDSGAWKQGALDACDRVLDAIHAHYSTQLDSLLKERDALQARVKELEAERDDALERVEELEQNAEVVSDEFEKDCWKAMRSLLSECKFDWRDVEPDGVTADDAREHIRETLKELESLWQREQSRATRLQQERDEAYERLKPFAAQADYWPEHPDNRAMMTSDGEDLSSLDFAMSDLRAARDLVRRLAGPEKA